MLSGTSTCFGSRGDDKSTDTVQVADGLVTWGSLAHDDPDAGHFEGCFLFVLGVYESCPAAASPPDPGWGPPAPVA